MIFAPVLELPSRRHERSRSTSFQRRPVISLLRAPVNVRRRMMAIAYLFAPPASNERSASPSAVNSFPERKRSPFLSAGRLTPRTGLSARSFSPMANEKIPPSRPTVREAVPLPPSTIARPRFLVLTSAAVFPFATSRMNRLTSAEVISEIRFLPSNGLMCLSMRDRVPRRGVADGIGRRAFRLGPG